MPPSRSSHIGWEKFATGPFSLPSELAQRKRYVSRKADLNPRFSPRLRASLLDVGRIRDRRRALFERGLMMWNVGRSARRVLLNPGAFALAVIKSFRANQGVLLAGAVAYYTLLSLVPVLIIVLIALSHIFAEERLLITLQEYLGFVVPGQSDALVEELRTFLTHREVVGGVLLVTMLFFSALAFTVLENAMSVIFFHRVAIRRRHFLVSAVMPYIFILFLGLGLLVTTIVSSVLQFVGTRNITVWGQAPILFS